MKLETRTASAWMAPAAISLGLAALSGRTPSWGAVVVTGAVGLIGIIIPFAPQREIERVIRGPNTGSWWIALLLGLAAVVAVARLPETVSPPAGPSLLFSHLIAAVGEEAFFRRLIYGWLARRGDTLAIWVSAAAFALVHVPVYGLQVLPIDLAAGLLFGWQRWMTGGWSAPALTHLAANLLA